MLITERPGRLRVLDKGKLSEPVKAFPRSTPSRTADCWMSKCIRSARNGWIYLVPRCSPASRRRPRRRPPAPRAGTRRGAPLNPAMTVIVRGKISKTNEWTDQQVIFRGPPEMPRRAARTSDRGSPSTRKDTSSIPSASAARWKTRRTLKTPLGKIHRVNDDGTVPKDNPFVNTAGAVPTIWSYGHRNPEGLAWDPVSGKLWNPSTDRTTATRSISSSAATTMAGAWRRRGSQGGITKTSEPGMDDPIVYYTPTLAPAGIAFYTGTQYPGWKNTSLFVCGLAGQQLRRLEISGDKVTKQEVIFNQFGRVRDIIQGPDGLFYIALQNPTGIPGVPLSVDARDGHRLVPVK
jgi:hypothetical protein